MLLCSTVNIPNVNMKTNYVDLSIMPLKPVHSYAWVFMQIVAIMAHSVTVSYTEFK